MATMRNLPPLSEEIKATEVVFELAPLNKLWLSHTPLKATTNSGGLKKGTIYHALFVTNRGQIALKGNDERLFPMDWFCGPRNTELVGAATAPGVLPGVLQNGDH